VKTASVRWRSWWVVVMHAGRHGAAASGMHGALHTPPGRPAAQKNLQLPLPCRGALFGMLRCFGKGEKSTTYGLIKSPGGSIYIRIFVVHYYGQVL
jgi:hypothetical protein